MTTLPEVAESPKMTTSPLKKRLGWSPTYSASVTCQLATPVPAAFQMLSTAAVQRTSSALPPTMSWTFWATASLTKSKVWRLVPSDERPERVRPSVSPEKAPP